MDNAQRIENAIKWIDTLRTTRMKQGRGELGNSKIGHCCLGVGCKMLGVKDYQLDMADAYLAHQNMVGLLDDSGIPKSNVIPKALAYLNDHGEFTFNEIAKLLIREPENYFSAAVAKGIRKHYASKS